MNLEESDLLYVSFITFEWNKAQIGGAIYTAHVDYQLSEVRACIFHENTAVDGGALYFQSPQGLDAVTSSFFLENFAGTSSVDKLTSTMHLRIAHRQVTQCERVKIQSNPSLRSSQVRCGTQDVRRTTLPAFTYSPLAMPAIGKAAITDSTLYTLES